MKAFGVGLGHQSLLRDRGPKMPICVWTGSSAAIGISTRSGLGELCHLETQTLWVLEKFRVGATAVRKVRGDVNPANLSTKHLPSKDEIHQLTSLDASTEMAAPRPRRFFGLVTSTGSRAATYLTIPCCRTSPLPKLSLTM